MPSGWTMFHVFTRAEIEPVFVQDTTSGQGDNDFLESALLRDSQPRPAGAYDFWRVSGDGKATLIRSYPEDREDLSAHARQDPGTWLSPDTMATWLIEF